MKVLITGSAGYIGQFTAKAAMGQGHHVIGADLIDDGFSFDVDLRDRGRVNWLVQSTQPDAIIHLAAKASVGDSMRNPYPYLRDNLEMIHNLLNTRHKIKRFVLASSASVYGDPNRTLFRQPALLSPYGQGKRQAEEICEWYAQIQGFEFVSLRYFNVCGGLLQCHQPESHILPLMMRAHQTGQNVSIFGESAFNGFRDYVHVSDVSGANVLALTSKPGTYDVATGTGVSIHWLIDTFADHDIVIPYEIAEVREGDPKTLIGDPGPLKKQGWKPDFGIADIVKEYVSMIQS